ncbi:MAG TPA: SAM-dependent methyltransferase [Parabacteroides sp.]|nr:SAM-dependent methyltransferase [Parabacteroides sp.]
MELTEQEKEYIRANKHEDISKLLLGAKRYPGLNVPFLVEQIASRRQIQGKLPSWAANDSLLFPSKISSEQCSSELTASYKQQLVSASDVLCDLTGGLGIDSYYFSRKVRSVVYVERFPLYCEVARHNFHMLKADNIQVVSADSRVYIEQLSPVDVFYLDPARRGEGNKRVFALSDCEPDLAQLLPRLLLKAKRVIVKISPMADIRQTMALLPGVLSVHVLSVKNECKELLFVIGREPVESPEIHCVNYKAADSSPQFFSFKMGDERDAAANYSSTVKKYLYEPNASILKAGAFKSVSLRYAMAKMHPNSHLYTSDVFVENFPGRIFEVEEVMPFSSKLAKTLVQSMPRANITVRNFPLSVEELRKKSKVKDGGDVYLFATVISANDKVLLRCRKAYFTGTKE